MVIHESGQKGERDRAKCTRDYRQLCRYFFVWPLSDRELAHLTNKQLYNLCEGIFNRQTEKAKKRFAEWLHGKQNIQYRLKPFAFKWFIYDLMRLSLPEKRVGNFLLSPFKYIKLRIKNAMRARAKAKEEALAEAEPLKMVSNEVAESKLELAERERFFGPGSEPAGRGN